MQWYGREVAECFMYLLTRSRWVIEAKGSFRCTVPQVYSEMVFQANLRVSVFVTGDTVIPGGLLSNKIPLRGCLHNFGLVTLPKINDVSSQCSKS